MNKDLHILNVVHIEELTSISREITFDISGVSSLFEYTPGQYITVHHQDDAGEVFIRCYSISSMADAKTISIGVKKVEGGKVSSYLVEELKVGDQLQIGTPEGNFGIAVSRLDQSDYFFFAGGSGITPIKSMISSLLAAGATGDIRLIFGNKDEENIMYRSYFQELAQRYSNFEVLHVLQDPSYDWTGRRGILDIDTTNVLIQESTHTFRRAHYYICGPSLMMDANEQAILALGVPAGAIHKEYFAIQAQETVEDAAVIDSTVQLSIGGERVEIPVQAGQTILAAAEEAGHTIPYSCRSGICSSCKCKMTKGEVTMPVTFGLGEGEEKAGYILACQAIPLTDQISIQYDSSYSKTTPRKKSRKWAVAIGMVLSVLFLSFLLMPSNEEPMAKGEMNKGHENLQCNDCHTKAKGTVMQQINANVMYVLGQRKSLVDFGLADVDNEKCQSCHERPNDRHPVHRFLEPRFVEVRNELHPEKCESCHLEHNGVRLSIETQLNYCQHCHEDTQLNNDPLDVTHEELIAGAQWGTCLQCHDFHGNHVMHAPKMMKDTIPMSALIDYARGGMDPYGTEKKYVAEKEKEAIREFIDSK